ncbi:MAG: PEGA domain-containing protein, partial [Myxococcota bacterium]
HPDDRYQSAKEMRRALEAIHDGVEAERIAEVVAAFATPARDARDALLATPVELPADERSGVKEKVLPVEPEKAPSRRAGMVVLALVAAALTVALAVGSALENTPAPEETAENTPAPEETAENTAAENTAAENTAAENTAAPDNTAEPAVPEVEVAVLRIDSQPPGAEVSLDGTPTGQQTPALLEDVSLGTHRVRLTREGYAALVEELSITEPRTELRLRLVANPPQTETRRQPERPAMRRPESTPAMTRGTAQLSLITAPSVTVYINGRSYGRTPMRRRTIPAGPVTLELRADSGATKRLSIDTEPGESISVPRTVVEP